MRPPYRLGLRALAWTCPSCGVLRTCPDGLLRVGTGRLPRCRCDYLRNLPRVRRNRRARWDADAGYRLAEQRRLNRRSWVNYQAPSLESATRSGVQWTGPEMELLARRDLTARQIAGMLGRTYYAVANARWRLQRDPRAQMLAGLTVEQSVESGFPSRGSLQ